MYPTPLDLRSCTHKFGAYPVIGTTYFASVGRHLRHTPPFWPLVPSCPTCGPTTDITVSPWYVQPSRVSPLYVKLALGSLSSIAYHLLVRREDWCGDRSIRCLRVLHLTTLCIVIGHCLGSIAGRCPQGSHVAYDATWHTAGRKFLHFCFLFHSHRFFFNPFLPAFISPLPRTLAGPGTCLHFPVLTCHLMAYRCPYHSMYRSVCICGSVRLCIRIFSRFFCSPCYSFALLGMTIHSHQILISFLWSIYVICAVPSFAARYQNGYLKRNISIGSLRSQIIVIWVKSWT